jgi:formylglycine-generating enzyme required for sulfatase activity
MKKRVVIALGLALSAGLVSAAQAAPKRIWRPAKAQLETAKKIGKPVFLSNSIGMKFVLIPAGDFVMGSPASEPGHTMMEGPQHRVKISRPFYLQTTEVTQAQWRAIMGKNPSHHQGCDQCPVEQVSGEDVKKFIRRLNAREKKNKYRLPTEAEWEYACRATTTTVYHFGNAPGRLGDHAWYADNSGNRTHPVAQKRPNPWGLFDMYGNVWEWCRDGYDGGYYAESPALDPPGPGEGTWQVVRGGSCFNNPRLLRSALRGGTSSRHSFSNLGFRMVRMP